jgi:hypothetical protein
LLELLVLDFRGHVCLFVCLLVCLLVCLIAGVRRILLPRRRLLDKGVGAFNFFLKLMGTRSVPTPLPLGDRGGGSPPYVTFLLNLMDGRGGGGALVSYASVGPQGEGYGHYVVSPSNTRKM